MNNHTVETTGTEEMQQIIKDTLEILDQKNPNRNKELADKISRLAKERKSHMDYMKEQFAKQEGKSVEELEKDVEIYTRKRVL